MGMATLAFANASCAHCARVVIRSLQKVDGVLSVEVDPEGRRILVGFDPSRVTLDSIRFLMERAGYPTRLIPPSHLSAGWGQLAVESEEYAETSSGPSSCALR